MITRKALARRTFLRGMGTAVALPVSGRDESGIRIQPAARQDAGPHGVCLRAERHHDERLESGLRRQAGRAAANSEAAGAVQGRHPAAGQPDPQHRAGAARWRGRSRPLLRLLPDRHTSSQDNHGNQSRFLLRPDRGEALERTDQVRLARSGPRRRAAGGRLRFRATPAPTPTIWHGGARRSRCLRFSIRGRCSSGCSAKASR